MNMNKNQNSSCPWKGERLKRKGCQEAFWNDGHVLYLYRALEYIFTGLCIYENSSNGTPQIFIFHYYVNYTLKN